jgi:hypothetical protein
MAPCAREKYGEEHKLRRTVLLRLSSRQVPNLFDLLVLEDVSVRDEFVLLPLK